MWSAGTQRMTVGVRKHLSLSFYLTVSLFLSFSCLFHFFKLSPFYKKPKEKSRLVLLHKKIGVTLSVCFSLCILFKTKQQNKVLCHFMVVKNNLKCKIYRQTCLPSLYLWMSLLHAVTLCLCMQCTMESV